MLMFIQNQSQLRTKDILITIFAILFVIPVSKPLLNIFTPETKTNCLREPVNTTRKVCTITERLLVYSVTFHNVV